MAEYVHGEETVSRHGFSLIELIVAIAIFSVIGMSLMVSYSLGVNVWKRVNLIEGMNETVNNAFWKLDTELMGVVPNTQIPFEGDDARLTFFTLKREKGALKLLKVSYLFENNALKCAQLDLAGSASKTFDVISPLTACSFEYAERSPSGGYEWSARHNPNDGMPGAVRVKITLPGNGDGTAFEKIFYIPAGGWKK